MSQHHERRHERLSIISWASPFVAFALLAFLFTSSIGRTQDQTTNLTDPRAKSFLGSAGSHRAQSTQQLICTISSFYSIDANEQISDVIRIEGRGLATCKNDQGFSTDVPVSSVITARILGNWSNAGELSFSGNSSSFVIPREIAQMQDTFDIKPFASDLNDKSSPTIFFQGQRHDLMIEMRFSSSTQALQKIEMISMSIHFDETAPTLD